MPPRQKQGKAGETSTGTGTKPAGRRPRLSQSDVPGHSLTEALRVPKALRDEYGKQATKPMLVAKALSMSPTSSNFRMITGAAVAYDLADGAAQADQIGLTALGRRIVAPTVEGDDLPAMREAVLRPRVVREFLTKYDQSKVPSTPIALNVLEEMGVPHDSAQRAFDMIIKNAQDVGFLIDNGGKNYVNLDGVGTPAAPAEAEAPDASERPSQRSAEARQETGADEEPASSAGTPGTSTAPGTNSLASNRRVFVTHGKNRKIVEQLKELLTFGTFEPIVSVEREAVAVPLPDKVMADMRSCGAGIVHVGAEQTLLDSEGKEHKVLNQNVLIEIGAALALYDRNFILLVEQGTQLPSNLQGLYEVRYEGDKLDYDATMKLLRAFNEFTAPGKKDG